MVKRSSAPEGNRKHRARAQRERIQRNWILGGVATIVIAVAGLLLYGVVGIFITPVATVNGENISTKDFRGRVRLSQAETVNQAIFRQQLELIPVLLSDVEGTGQRVLNQMIDDVLIRQEVELRGGTVTDAEIDKAMAEAFGFFPDGTPTSFPTFTPDPTITALASITPTITEGPSPTPQPSQTPGPSPTVTATATTRPTATEYVEEAYLANLEITIEGLQNQFDITRKDFRNQFVSQLYRRKLLEFFEAEETRATRHIQARHILVEDEDLSNQVLEMLNEGSKWEDLALEFSIDESNKARGGDLGWIPRGLMVPEFEEAVFTGVVGEILGPVETEFGFHLIEILGQEDRDLDEYSFQLAVQTTFNTWLINIHRNSIIDISKNWLLRVPDAPNIGAPAPSSSIP
ncbi:MAG: peptidylprolyl isomerase [Chloroflexi bacterium]|nr:peptidylprolyl isomerase [Chloroflexota bacterium]